MSLELIDARIKITKESDVAVEAHSQAHGIDRSEIMRDVIHEWSLRQIKAASLIQRGMAREGLSGADEGTQGTAPIKAIRS